MKQYITLEDSVYFGFAANDTSGSGGDGATPTFDVRLAGAAASAAPVHSGTPDLLTHANYPAGAHEINVAATAANGFAAGNTYLVFCNIAIDSQTPTGFVGSFDTMPVESNLQQMGDSAQSAADLKDFADAGYDPATNKVEGAKLVDVTTENTDMVDVSNLDAAVSTRSSHSAADVWAAGTRTLTSFGTLVADIWANVTRTITGGTVGTVTDGAKEATLTDRTILAADYFDPTNDVVARVTLVDTTTENTDMVAEAPTAAEIDTELSGTHGAGSWLTGGGGSAPTVEEIDAELTSSHGAGSWTSGAAGSGPIEYPYEVTDLSTGFPLEGVSVWVTTDIGGGNTVAGVLTTNNFGLVTFYLDAGTYYFWSKKAGFNFVNPDTEVVS